MQNSSLGAHVSTGSVVLRAGPPESTWRIVMVVLVAPRHSSWHFSPGGCQPPLSLGYLAAVLERDGIEVSIIDAAAEALSADEVARRALALGASAVGITSITANRFEAIRIAELIKKGSDALVVVGGPHFSVTAADALRVVPSIDLVVRGEGEVTVREVVRASLERKGFADIAGVSYRDRSGRIIENPDRPVVASLELLPLPAYHLFDFNKYRATEIGQYRERSAAGIMTSRGCPHDCTFCVNRLMWHRRFRRREPSKVVDELELLVRRYSFACLHIWDDCFTLVKTHVSAICEEIIRRRLRFRWFAMARVDTVDAKVLALMKKAGCVTVGFGIESGSQAALDRMRKGITLEMIDRAVRWALDAGFVVTAYFVVGLPGDTHEDVAATLRLMTRLRRNGGSMIKICPSLGLPFPGTDLERAALAEGHVFPEGFSWNKYHEFEMAKLCGQNPVVPVYHRPGLDVRLLRKQITRLSGVPHGWLPQKFAHLTNYELRRLVRRKLAERLGRLQKRLGWPAFLRGR